MVNSSMVHLLLSPYVCGVLAERVLLNLLYVDTQSVQRLDAALQLVCEAGALGGTICCSDLVLCSVDGSLGVFY